MPEMGAKVRAVIINTNLYYKNNLVTKDDEDPAGQFVWLNRTLSYARTNREKVVTSFRNSSSLFERANSSVYLRAQPTHLGAFI